jgi:hypothetical protein
MVLTSLPCMLHVLSITLVCTVWRQQYRHRMNKPICCYPTPLLPFRPYFVGPTDQRRAVPCHFLTNQFYSSGQRLLTSSPKPGLHADCLFNKCVYLPYTGETAWWCAVDATWRELSHRLFTSTVTSQDSYTLSAALRSVYSECLFWWGLVRFQLPFSPLCSSGTPMMANLLQMMHILYRGQVFKRGHVKTSQGARKTSYGVCKTRRKIFRAKCNVFTCSL